MNGVQAPRKAARLQLFFPPGATDVSQSALSLLNEIVGSPSEGTCGAGAEVLPPCFVVIWRVRHDGARELVGGAGCGCCPFELRRGSTSGSPPPALAEEFELIELFIDEDPTKDAVVRSHRSRPAADKMDELVRLLARIVARESEATA